MKKVLIFSLVYYPDFVGGAEVAIKQITDRVDSVNFDMVTLRGDRKSTFETVGSVNVYRVGWVTGNSLFFALQKLLFPFLAYWKSRKLHKKNQYSSIWAMMANQAGFAAMFLKKKFPEIHFVLTLQEGDPIPDIKKKVRFVWGWFVQIFTRSNTVTAISEYLKKFGIEMGAKHVEVIPNGVDLSVFAKDISQQEKQDLRNLLGITSSSRVIVTTSRLVVKNGIGDVIRSMEHLPKDVIFLVLGVGDLEHKLKQLAKDLSVSDRVIFAGFIPYEQISKYFAISDVFVRTSLSEGLGNSFLEAMYFGLPTVGTNVGGIKDFLFDEETGFVCRSRDVESISFAISRALDHGSDVIESAQTLVENRFNWDSIAKKFELLWK